MTASISDRTIEALTAIATGLHDIADAVRETGQYDDRVPVFEDDEPEEAQIDAQEPAEQPRTDSAGGETSGGLGERLRALVAEPDPEESQYESVDVAALVGLADEAHRLEVHARVVERSLRTARAEGDGARIKAEQWKARYEETRAFARWAAMPDHPLGKVIGVVREFGTEHYKTEEAPAGSPFRMPEDRAPVADHPLGRTAGELFGPSSVALPALEAGRITFAPELQAELNEQIDQWGKRLGDRVRAEMGLPTNESEEG